MYCIDCQYDLRSLDGARCPECGRAFSAADPRTYLAHRNALTRMIPTLRGWLAIALGLVTGVLPAALEPARSGHTGLLMRPLSILDWSIALIVISITIFTYASAAMTRRTPNVVCAAIGVAMAGYMMWYLVTQTASR